jgi:hypothetical protein
MIHNLALHVRTTVYNRFEIFSRKIVVNISKNLPNALAAQYLTCGHVKNNVTGSTYFSIF